MKNACTMASRLGMNIILYHALPLPTGFAQGSPVGGMYDALDKNKRQIEEGLRELIKKVNKDDQISFQIVITYGPVSRGLKELEQHNDVGLVLMTSRGANGFLESLAGSNAYHVVKEMDCPVIVLPEKSNIAAMKTIALAGDYSEPTAPELLEKLIEINRAFFAHLEIIHIHDESGMDNDEIDIARNLQKYLKDVPHSFHFKQYDDVKEGLLEFCKESKVDLLAMIPRQHSLLERLSYSSKTKKMVEDIPVPLMVLQD
jgi:nucleotide-binding universal stress UspA family protein